ncbi:hypothetical protein GQX74_013387 [Glossina fuscipes]|nr:hypothetical protein GQX74_013387 [Glossina fuscipes]
MICMRTVTELLFCEYLDSIIRMSAEENLNKIFRVLERTRVNRILMDLYGEIKRNGNQRFLRICLKIFAYYAQNIREHHIHLNPKRNMSIEFEDRITVNPMHEKIFLLKVGYTLHMLVRSSKHKLVYASNSPYREKS